MSESILPIYNILVSIGMSESDARKTAEDAEQAATKAMEETIAKAIEKAAAAKAAQNAARLREKAETR